MIEDDDKPETDDDILAEEIEEFERAAMAENDNRLAALDDLRFGRLS